MDNLRDGATKVCYGPGLSQIKNVWIQGTVSDHWRDKLALKEFHGSALSQYKLTVIMYKVLYIP